ncbi:hypothetical protein PybrP1_008855 [[Pythium] brassicae (nom. inval.)]|nr:hypothetical protein PybrP1_008855 [[Pythium] brassicae (nom. inval.)]
MALEPPLKPPKLAAATRSASSSSASSSSSSFLTLSSSLFGASRGDAPATFDDVTVRYATPGPLLLDLFSRESDHGRGAFVRAFRQDASGAPGCAETSGLVRVGDELLAINGAVASEMPFAAIVQAAKSAAFPLTLTFRRHASPETRRSLRPPASPAKGSNGARTSSFSVDGGPSPSASSSWAAKLGQMMAESGIKRSASYEKKLSEQSAGSVTSGSLGSPSSGGDSTPTGLSTPGKLKHVWGDGLTLDKVKNSDGMKNLLRMIGGKAKPEEDRETVSMWFDQLLLRPDSSVAEQDGDAAPVNSLYHSTPIVAVTAGGRMLAVRDDDASEFAVAWYRRTAANDLIHIKGAASGRYFPSVDDVGATLSAHVQSLRFPPLARVVEFPRALQIDPAVGELVDALLEAGAGAFSATLASNEHDSFQLKISAERVALVKISEHDADAGVVATAAYDPHVQVLLDPTDRLRFTLKVREFGSFLGNRRGDTCRVQQRAFTDYSCFFLVAQNPQHRDILALLVRRFRARTLSSAEEHQAHRDEINLFMDPAFACATLARPPPPPPLGSASPLPSDGTASPPVATGARTNSFSVLASQPPPVHGLEPVRGRRSSSDGARTASASRFADLFNLEQEGEGGGGSSSPPARDPQPVPLHRKASASTAAAAPDAFLQSRVASQAKEITMLQEKLGSLSVLLKALEHEKRQVQASVEVKDQRIELQQRRVRQLEKLAAHSAAQTRELQALRAKLESEERLRAATQQQLERALALQDAGQQQRCDQATQTESRAATSGGGGGGPARADGWVGDDVASQLSPRSINFEMDFMASAVAALEQQLAAQTREAARLQDEQSAVVAARNAFRAKAHELSKELRRVVTASRSLADVEAQLAERSALATQLAVAKAEAKRASDESKEFKDALECVLRQRGMGDRDKDTQRVLSQNLDLQRVVHQLTDSLNETKEQMAALQSINGALMTKLHSLQPDARGSILFESPLNSPGSVASARLHPSFSSDEDNSDSDSNDDDDEDDGEAGEGGSAVLTRSL